MRELIQSKTIEKKEIQKLKDEMLPLIGGKEVVLSKYLASMPLKYNKDNDIVVTADLRDYFVKIRKILT